jgi:hypothetical protein
MLKNQIENSQFLLSIKKANKPINAKEKHLQQKKKK